MNLIILTLSSFFYVGYLPLIPGTFGSFAGLVLFFLVKNNPGIYLISTLAVIILGYLVSGRAEEIAKIKDARFIVIDEVSGMLLSLIFLPYYNVAVICAGFLLFRLLDTFKPFPAGRFEKLKGSAGIMGDDLVAGIYTNIILQVVLRLASFKVA